MKSGKKRLSFWVALAAAYLLVLQSVTGALALGAQPERAMLDAFGNPLCITSQSDTGTGNQTKMPNCCVIGCSMFTQVLGTPPDDAAAAIDAPIVSQVVLHLESIQPLAVRDYRSGNPRAPPLTY